MNQQLISEVTNEYQLRYKGGHVLISSPGRINIIGEHTDYNDGFALPAAIDMGIVAALGKSEDALCSAYAINMNEVYKFSTETIKPISGGSWRNYIIGVVAELQHIGISVPPFNLVFAGDIPNGAGLSSSAALENSIVFGLNELFNLQLPKSEMILISQRAEHNYAGVRCGIMDQYASMFGQESHALLLDCRIHEARPIKIDFQDYQLVLINTNVSHNLVEAEYNDRREVCEKVTSILKVNALRDANERQLQSIKSEITEADYQKALYIIQENERVLKAVKMIEQNDLLALGAILFDAHNGASNQFKISCPELDFLVDQARIHKDAIGARMMGGGFGGCTINIVKKDAVDNYLEDVSQAYFNKFNKRCSPYVVSLSKGTCVSQN
ncbi:galactokinase [Flavobacteriaceae bacterium MAR_2010_72]|nr:galactokinase [Flavobacteriaceae bacterium MAR_2010_72]